MLITFTIHADDIQSLTLAMAAARQHLSVYRESCQAKMTIHLAAAMNKQELEAALAALPGVTARISED